VEIQRRIFLSGVAAVAISRTPAMHAATGETRMYGLIGTMTARPGQGADLAAVLLDGVAGMPGCLSYVVAQDPGRPDTLWVTEVWESQAAHEASLSLPSVREAIGKGRPMIAGMDAVAQTVPLGGHGLSEDRFE
jgi:quinol monooxygenase YgiN